jgi:hypothetical protein
MIYFKTSAPFLVACPTIPVEADSDDEPPSFAADASTVEVAAIIVDTLHRLGFSARLVSVAGDSHEEINASHRVFNLMEGDAADPAREVRFAAWMEARNIPFTGNPAAALSLALRKDLARERLAARRVPIAPGRRRTRRALRPPRPPRPPGSSSPPPPTAPSASMRAPPSPTSPALRARVAWLQKHLGGACLIERYLPGAEVNVSLFPDRRGELQVALSALDFSACPPGHQLRHLLLQVGPRLARQGRPLGPRRRPRQPRHARPRRRDRPRRLRRHGLPRLRPHRHAPRRARRTPRHRRQPQP